jgi:hypothetical protein
MRQLITKTPKKKKKKKEEERSGWSPSLPNRFQYCAL